MEYEAETPDSTFDSRKVFNWVREEKNNGSEGS